MDTPLPRLSRWSAKQKELSRFDDHSESERALIGPRPRGQIRVDCHFMFRQSKWGTLTKAKHPGGIVYIDLDFHQPQDCRLKSATVRLTLDDSDPALASFTGVSTTPGKSNFTGVNATPSKSNPSVHILRHGPEQFCGQPSRAYKTTRHSALPRFDLGGVAGAGGVGRESERHTVEESRWDFASHLTRSDDAEGKSARRTPWASNQLIWTLTENQLAGRAVRNSTVHTGFAFAHGGQPFFMKLEVSGRLESRLSNAYKSFRQAFGSSSRSDSFATTLIEFGDVTRFRMPLDPIADRLARTMTEKNISSSLYEIPNTKPATSHEEDLVSDGPSANVPEPCLPAHQTESISSTLWDLASENNELALTPQGLEEQKRVFDFLTQPSPSQTNYGGSWTTRSTSPSPEDGGDLLRPAITKRRGQSLASETSEMTLVDEQQPSTVYPDVEDKGKAEEEPEAVDSEAVLRVLRLCGVWAMTQAILGLLAYCGVFVVPRRNRPAIAAKKVCIDEDPRPEEQTAPRTGRKRTRMSVDSVAPG